MNWNKKSKIQNKHKNEKRHPVDIDSLKKNAKFLSIFI